MLRVKDICRVLENHAPTAYQESYDNSGLIVGDENMSLSGVVFSVDITEAVIEDALGKNANMIVAHHPIIFKGLKQLTGKDYVQRTVIKAIKNNIALYASHTNLDSVQGGINTKICEKINLQKIKILSPKTASLLKLITFVPNSHIETVRKALFNAGCGHIGNYDQCSFSSEGKGTFRALHKANPFVGERNKMHQEKEVRIETVFPSYLQYHIIKELELAHPYEEVAYDLYPIQNTNPNVGIGCVGELSQPMPTNDFLALLKKTFNLQIIRHTEICKNQVQKVAVCGGSGSFLLKNALRAQADIFVTGDFKYHDFFDADKQIIIADIGHYESERCSMEIFNELITEKFPNFATYFTNANTNPINYFL